MIERRLTLSRAVSAVSVAALTWMLAGCRAHDPDRPGASANEDPIGASTAIDDDSDQHGRTGDQDSDGVFTPIDTVRRRSGRTAPSTDRPPNIVLITTDDMSRDDLRWMPTTRRLLGDLGARVEPFVSSHPLCCPARAQILTGQLAQNNGVRSNTGRHGGYQSLRDPGDHVGTWLRAAGYRTAFLGKHLNGWAREPTVQAGWTFFDPVVRGVYSPDDVTMYENGDPRRYRGIHTTDLMGRLTTETIERFSESGDPFFIWTSYLAPHAMRRGRRFGPPIPAERHEHEHPDARPARSDELVFFESDTSDKPPWVDERRRGPAAAMRVHRARVRTLLAVDDQVEATLRALDESGELDRTYVFFTSDNGKMMGEHGLLSKNVPYEPSLRVPLLVRGPTIPAGVEREGIHGLVDLAPTFAHLAGASPTRTQDGRSMLPTLEDGTAGYSHVLIQAFGETAWWWRGIRSTEFTYVRYDDGFEELYDLDADPLQLRNVAAVPAYSSIKEDHAAWLSDLEGCAGASCRAGDSRRSGAAGRQRHRGPR